MGRNTLLSAGSTLTAAIALVLGVLAVATPYWATFTDNLGNEQGHFGAWTLCRERDSVYRCGPSRLRPSEYTAAAGVCGIVALLLTLVVCVMSPLVLAMRVTRRQLFVKFRHAVLAKLVISCVSVTCCMLTLILFGIDVDGQQLGQSTGFQVTRGWSYYLLVVYTLLSLSLTGFAAAEFVLARRLGGDPVKMSRDPAGSLAPVIVNPSVAKHHHQQHHQLQQLQLQQQLTAAPAAGGSCNYSSNGHGNGCAVAVIGSSCPPAVVFQRVSAAAAGPLPHHATYSNQLATLDVKAAAAAAAAAASGGGWGGDPVDNERLTSHGWMTSSNIGETATATATATSAAVRQTGQPLAFDPRRQPLRSSMKKRPHATTTRDPATGTATATATGTNSNNDSSSCRMAYSVTFDTAPHNGNSNNNSSNNSNINNNSNSNSNNSNNNNNNNNNNNSHIQFADEGVVIIPNRQAAVTAATVVVDAAVHDQLSPAVASYSSVHNSGGSIRSKKVRIQTLDTPV